MRRSVDASVLPLCHGRGSPSRSYCWKSSPTEQSRTGCGSIFLSHRPDDYGYLYFVSFVIGLPNETAEGRRCVALVPEVVTKLVDLGAEVRVERSAGNAAYLYDAAF